MPQYTEEQWARIEKRIAKAIDEIPGNGNEWDMDTRAAYLECAYEMVAQGMGITQAYHLLSGIYHMHRGETA